MKVQVINLSNNKLPQYETPMSAGMDIRADFSRVTVDNPIKLYVLYPQSILLHVLD